MTDFVREGDSLPFAPEVQATLNGRYEWDVAGGRLAHVMGFLSYSDEVNTDIVAENSIELDSWYLLGATAGISDDQWDRRALRGEPDRRESGDIGQRHFQRLQGNSNQTSHHRPAFRLRLLRQRSQDPSPGVKLAGTFSFRPQDIS